jgi:hypothetical protein
MGVGFPQHLRKPTPIMEKGPRLDAAPYGIGSRLTYVSSVFGDS